MKRGGYRGGFRGGYRGASGSHKKPMYNAPRNYFDQDNDEETNDGSLEVNQPNTNDISFSTEREPGSYIGWKLYFPLKRKLFIKNVLAQFLISCFTF